MKDILNYRITEEDFVGEVFCAKQNSRTGLVIVPGSAGVLNSCERAYARYFAERGICCIIPDPFSLKGITQCLTNQTAMPLEILTESAFAAHGRLKEETELSSCGIMGVSKGGAVALLSALHLPWLSEQPSFDFHISLVPPVHFQLRRPQALGTPILVHLAELDDFTPPAPAKQYLNRIKAENPELFLKVRTIAKVGHVLENSGESRWLPTAERYYHCQFWIEDNGTVTDEASGKNMSLDDLRKVMRSYAMLGAHYGGGNSDCFFDSCDELYRFVRRFSPQNHH